MAELVRYTVRDGLSVVVEIDERPRATGPVSRRNDVVHDLGQAFDRHLTEVREAAVTALRTLRACAETPDEIKLSFGVKLTAEAGAVIARTALEGNLAVELSWRRAP